MSGPDGRRRFARAGVVWALVSAVSAAVVMDRLLLGPGRGRCSRVRGCSSSSAPALLSEEYGNCAFDCPYNVLLLPLAFGCGAVAVGVWDEE